MLYFGKNMFFRLEFCVTDPTGLSDWGVHLESAF